MEDGFAVTHRDWFKPVVSTDAANPFLTERAFHAFDVREDQHIPRAAADQGVHHHRLEEGEAQRVRRENDARPWRAG
ncbi:hypothetical protein D3C87_1541380 [compost metagenome]